MNTSNFKHIVFEYLSGRVTAIENQAVEDWLSRPENVKIFHEWLMEWELRSPQFSPNTEAAFKKLIKNLDETENVETEIIFESTTRNSSNNYWKALAIAASLFLLVGGIWSIKDFVFFRTYKTDYAEISSFLLEDGSHVSLNVNSTLKVPRWGFENKIREVFLQGEAEFSVTHTADNKRFVVKISDQFQIEVLGTEFSVFARQRGTKVVLNRGKIRINYASGLKTEQLLMKPGDLVTLNQQGKIALEKTPEPQNYSAWKTQRFVFNGTSVREIVTLLNENFGVEYIVSDEEIASRTISGTFKAQTADELLEVLSEVLKLKVINSGKGNVLTNK